jgi:hypothetical protein
MHAITLTAVLAITTLMIDARARKLGDDDPRRLRLADRLVVLCVGIGVVATATSVVDLFAMLGMVLERDTLEVAMAALARGGVIVPAPLIWSLMAALPLWIVSTVQRHRVPEPRRRAA